MFKSIIAVSLLFFISACTINGKKLEDMIDKKESEVKEVSKVTKAPTIEKEITPTDSSKSESKKSSSGIHFKWANKEYHDGSEDIFGIKKED